MMSDQRPIIVHNYLTKYGMKFWQAEVNLSNHFNNIVIVPAVQEFQNIIKLIDALNDNDKKYFDETLVLFVINNLKSSSQEVKEDNKKTLELLRNIIYEQSNNELNIGLVDASANGFELPEKEGGVGLARKIGMDLALTLFNYSINRKKILICLDADCIVSENYLSTIVQSFNQSNMQAAYVSYEHILPEDETSQRAIICYELFLRYYYLGLKYACSPFAFPTIGSTMVCDYESYIKIGGMNKKKAAEDFYFMEKLAKTTEIKKIDSATVYPSSRGSWRVPFGTGQRVNRYLNNTHNEYVLFDPKSFQILKLWLEIFNSKKNFTTAEYLSNAKSIHTSLHKFLQLNSFEKSWDKIVRSSKSANQIQRQKLLWFDGFRTFKLIHFLRDNGFPMINMFDALDELLRIENEEPARGKVRLRIERKEPVPGLDKQIEYLSMLRKLS